MKSSWCMLSSLLEPNGEYKFASSGNLCGQDLVVSQNKGTPRYTPIYYSACYGDPQHGTPNFGKPPFRDKAYRSPSDFELGLGMQRASDVLQMCKNEYPVYPISAWMKLHFLATLRVHVPNKHILTQSLH